MIADVYDITRINGGSHDDGVVAALNDLQRQITELYNQVQEFRNSDAS